MTTTLTARSSLTVLVSELWRLRESYAETYERETAWDGGEFSGPAISASYERDVREALRVNGWTAVELEDELAARTTSRWAHFSGLLDGTFTATCDEHGRQDVVDSHTSAGLDPSLVCKLACGCVSI